MTQERRLTAVLEKYWDGLREGRAFPMESEIDPEELKHIWDHCFLIKTDKSSEGEEYKYTFLGQELINAYGDDISQEEVNVLVQPNKARMIKKVEETIESKEPVHDESEFVNANSVHIRYRKIFLPLGYDDHVTHVIGGMRWKGY